MFQFLERGVGHVTCDGLCCNYGGLLKTSTAQKMKFSIKDFFSKCDQIRSFLRIWSRLLKKSIMENFIFCEMKVILVSHFIYPWLFSFDTIVSERGHSFMTSKKVKRLDPASPHIHNHPILVWPSTWMSLSDLNTPCHYLSPWKWYFRISSKILTMRSIYLCNSFFLFSLLIQTIFTILISIQSYCTLSSFQK